MKYASVVQWIERQIPVLNVGGSSPFGRAKKKACNRKGYRFFLFCLGGSFPFRFPFTDYFLGVTKNQIYCL